MLRFSLYFFFSSALQLWCPCNCCYYLFPHVFFLKLCLHPSADRAAGFFSQSPALSQLSKPEGTDNIFVSFPAFLSFLCPLLVPRVRRGTPKGGRTRGLSFSTTTPSGLTWACPSTPCPCSPSSGDPRQPEPRTWDQWWCTAGMVPVTNHPRHS